ncbi:MAG TPA: pyridoxamine 5'-phosphate oxidase [Thermoleophilaceae bacterium]|nr:pyridoxamine 5'-phosphate oxidase [Thermoleophilaceae bacterium]
MSGSKVPLRREELDGDPVAQLARWLEAARAAGVPEPEAAALATATAAGEPSARMVLVKGLDELGLRFFTSYESRKGRELAANPRAALLFHWKELGRQVRAEGPVSRLRRAETEAYAHSRGRSSQLSALASPQSQVVESREWLEERVRRLDAEHAGRELPVAESWGGLLLSPVAFEFWQDGEARLHDRFRYTRRAGGGWAVERLAP